MVRPVNDPEAAAAYLNRVSNPWYPQVHYYLLPVDRGSLQLDDAASYSGQYGPTTAMPLPRSGLAPAGLTPG